MPTDDSLKKFNRVLAILTQLQSSRITKAPDLANRFGVSLRTIYRDIKTLERMGVPIYGEAGLGYSLAEGYRLPPVMFTKEEANSFVTAEKLMDNFTDEDMRNNFRSAMGKIKSVLRTPQKDRLETMESKMSVFSHAPSFNADIPDALSILMDSINDKMQIELSYQAVDSDDITSRRIEAVGVFHEYSFWYVIAYCHLRQDYRQFRIDRIRQIKKTSSSYVKKHENLEFYRKKPESSCLSTIRIKVDRKIARFLQHDRKYYGFVEEVKDGDSIEMLFHADFLNNGFARWYMMFGDWAEILEPEALKAEVREILTRLNQKLDI